MRPCEPYPIPAHGALYTSIGYMPFGNLYLGAVTNTPGAGRRLRDFHPPVRPDTVPVRMTRAYCAPLGMRFEAAELVHGGDTIYYVCRECRHMPYLLLRQSDGSLATATIEAGSIITPELAAARDRAAVDLMNALIRKETLARTLVRIGMTSAELRSVMGTPVRSLERETASGVTEVWAYDGMMVTLRRGRVVAIEKF